MREKTWGPAHRRVRILYIVKGPITQCVFWGMRGLRQRRKRGLGTSERLFWGRMEQVRIPACSEGWIACSTRSNSHRITCSSRQTQTGPNSRRNNRQMPGWARLRFVILAWAGASLFFTAVLEVSELGHKQLGFALYSNAVHFALWALAVPLFASCIQRFPLKDGNRIRNGGIRLALIAVLATLVVVTHWAVIFLTWFPFRDATYIGLLRSEAPRFLPNEVLIGIVLVTAIEAWQVLRDLQAERVRATELQRQLAVSRLEALRMQLQPHFLFNTLHTIAGLTVEDPPTARRMVIALGDLLRTTLMETGSRMRTLAEELEYSDLYLGIEKLRLGDRLALNYEIEPAAARVPVPQLLLQPLFENAICHGASRITGSCEIRFSAIRRPHTLEIVICNDGPIRDPSSGPPRFGVGLTNTMDRLRIHYGDRHTFRYADRAEGGARIEISIPCGSAEDGAGARGSIPDRATIPRKDSDAIPQVAAQTVQQR
jgi:two-component system, LytTR family, sensor kinase